MAKNIARERHLTGWEINREDGPVDMELQGPSVQISALMDDLQDCYAGWVGRKHLPFCRARA